MLRPKYSHDRWYIELTVEMKRCLTHRTGMRAEMTRHGTTETRARTPEAVAPTLLKWPTPQENARAEAVWQLQRGASLQPNHRRHRLLFGMARNERRRWEHTAAEERWCADPRSARWGVGWGVGGCGHGAWRKKPRPALSATPICKGGPARGHTLCDTRARSARARVQRLVPHAPDGPARR